MISKKTSDKELIKKSYENFPLWSSIYLKKLMPDLASIYYFCRTVDDLSDLNKDMALKELKKVEELLDDCYAGSINENNVFFNLRKTISK